MNEALNLASTPEAQVLALCSRTSLDAAGLQRLRSLLATRLDWATIANLAHANSVASLLYATMQRFGSKMQGVPSSVANDLRTHFLANTARNLHAERTLIDEVTVLQENGIPVIAFKGPVLAVTAYGNRSLREYVDLDLLVRRRDLRRALALLHARGYRRLLGLSGAARLAYLQSECAIDVARHDGISVIEVHWDLMPRYFSLPFALEQVWRDAESLLLCGAAVRTLDPTHLLLFLCLHGGKHRWEQLRWICDVAELLRVRPDLSWPDILGKARQMGGGRMLLLGALLAAELLDAPVPDEVRGHALADPAILWLARNVGHRIFETAEESFADRNLFHLRAMDSLTQRLRYCLHVAMVPSKLELAARPLPAALSAFHYPLHLGDITGRSLAEVGSRGWNLALRAAGLASAPHTPPDRTGHSHRHEAAARNRRVDSPWPTAQPVDEVDDLPVDGAAGRLRLWERQAR